MKKPYVSVIIPSYNSAHYIEECVHSVLSQTYQNFEIIVIEDGSTDNSSQIISQEASRDARIHLFRQAHCGVGNARNLGLRNAQGEYVLFLDADDVLHPKCLEKAVSAAQKYAADFVVWNYISFTTGPAFSSLEDKPLDIRVTANPIMLGNARIHYVVWGKLYRKDLLKDITFALEPVFEDLPFVYAVLAKHPTTVLLNAALYGYRNTPFSLSNQSFCVEHIQACSHAISSIISLYSAPDLRQEASFLKQDFIPSILKNQLYRCYHCPVQQKKHMLRAFAAELNALHQRGWLISKGHRFDRYLLYRYLILKHKYFRGKENE